MGWCEVEERPDKRRPLAELHRRTRSVLHGRSSYSLQLPGTLTSGDIRSGVPIRSNMIDFSLCAVTPLLSEALTPNGDLGSWRTCGPHSFCETHTRFTASFVPAFAPGTAARVVVFTSALSLLYSTSRNTAVLAEIVPKAILKTHKRFL